MKNQKNASKVKKNVKSKSIKTAAKKSKTALKKTSKSKSKKTPKATSKKQSKAASSKSPKKTSKAKSKSPNKKTSKSKTSTSSKTKNIKSKKEDFKLKNANTKSSKKKSKPTKRKTKLINTFLILVLVAIFSYVFTAPVLFKYHYTTEFKKANLKVGKIKYENDYFSYLESEDFNDDDKETLLFVHGFQSNKEFWIPYFKKYHNEYNIVAFDLPAHGKSSTPKKQKYDLVSLSNSLELFVEKKNLKEFHLISTSMGGGISTVYSYNNPEKVKSLILLNPLGIDQEKKSDLQHMMDRGENILFPKDLNEFDEMMVHVIGKGVSFNSYFKEYILLKLMQKYPVHKKAFHELLTTSKPVDDILPKIETNSLIIIGQKDRIIHPNSYEYFVNLMPNAKAYRMKKAPHVFVEKHFDRANAVMQSFLKDNAYN